MVNIGNNIIRVLKDILIKRNFTIKYLPDNDIIAFKDLKPIGLKKRKIFFYITSVDKLTLDAVKKINKKFNKHKPGGIRTFFYYNVVIVTRDFEMDALRFVREKMTEAWNVESAFTWNVLASSYTKVTHIFDTSRQTLLYPYDYEDMKTLMHPEVVEIIEELLERI